MPLVRYECKCGVQYDDLVGMGYESSPCPQCGSLDRKPLPSTCVFKGDFGRPKDPLEHQALMENRHFQEELILSGARDLGEFDVKEAGPDEYRPFGNDSLTRKQAIENDKLINGTNQG